jgi:hypothetical protein
MNLLEGGNIFKTADGQEITTRIKRDDVGPTIAWLQKVLGEEIPLVGMELGSTGKKETSGDLDIAIDQNLVNAEQLTDILKSYLAKQGIPESEWMNVGYKKQDGWIKFTKNQVSFKTPIRGDAANGFVQTDLMLVPDVTYAKYGFHHATDSNFKSAHRNALLSSIAKAVGYTINQRDGIYKREDPDKTIITKDWNQIAKLLLNPNARREDLHSVETIMNALANDPKRDIKIKDAAEYFAREGLSLDMGVSESYFLAKLRDRIATPGIYGLYESEILTEGARIEHLEDLIFQGAPGIQRVIKFLTDSHKMGAHTTIKWDGRPAIIFGRNEAGEFVLTDKAGFTATKYDGMVTKPGDYAAMFANRKGDDYAGLIKVYKTIFPLLERAVPESFRGYIQGDLLYVGRPTKRNNAYSFTPNTVTYNVDANSDIGRVVGKSEMGVAIHSYIDAPGGKTVPLKHAPDALQHSPGVVMLDPEFDAAPDMRLSQAEEHLVMNLETVAPAAARFMDPSAYRALKLSNLPELIKQYVNMRVRAGHYDNFEQGFLEWIDTSNQSQPKIQRIKEYVTNDEEGFAALVNAFLIASAVKTQIVKNLDRQTGPVTAHIAGEPGHEGYVTDSGDGAIKLVDRMRFSSANFAKNNPDLK